MIFNNTGTSIGNSSLDIRFPTDEFFNEIPLSSAGKPVTIGPRGSQEINIKGYVEDFPSTANTVDMVISSITYGPYGAYATAGLPIIQKLPKSSR